MPNKTPTIMLKMTKIIQAKIATRIAWNQPVSKLALKTQIQAISANMYPKINAAEPIIAPRERSIKKVTIKYTIGPARDASNAPPKVAFPPVTAFPASQTGIEMIIQSIIKPIRVASKLETVSVRYAKNTRPTHY